MNYSVACVLQSYQAAEWAEGASTADAADAAEQSRGQLRHLSAMVASCSASSQLADGVMAPWASTSLQHPVLRLPLS